MAGDNHLGLKKNGMYTQTQIDNMGLTPYRTSPNMTIYGNHEDMIVMHKNENGEHAFLSRFPKDSLKIIEVNDPERGFGTFLLDNAYFPSLEPYNKNAESPSVFESEGRRFLREKADGKYLLHDYPIGNDEQTIDVARLIYDEFNI